MDANNLNTLPDVQFPSAVALSGCRVINPDASALQIGLADVIAALQAMAFHPCADLEVSVTGNATGSIAAASTRPNLIVPAYLVKTSIGRDDEVPDISCTISGHRVGTVAGGSDAISAACTIIPEAGVEAYALLYFAEAVRSGRYYPTAYQLTYHASTPVTASAVISGHLSGKTTKIYPLTNGSRFFDDVLRHLRAMYAASVAQLRR